VARPSQLKRGGTGRTGEFTCLEEVKKQLSAKSPGKAAVGGVVEGGRIASGEEGGAKTRKKGRPSRRRRGPAENGRRLCEEEKL